MKKITLSVLTAGLVTVSAYAASPTGATPFQVSVPNLKPGASVTLEGLYVQPTASNLDYGRTVDSTGSNINHTILDPNYDFGFGIGLGYTFPRSGNDVQVKWQHFDHTTTENGLYDGARYTYDANSNVNFKFDTVDLDVGQYVDFGTRFATRLSAGFSYSDLKEGKTNTYINQDTTASSDIYAFRPSFEGVGPRLGVDAVYHVGSCFGVVSHIGTALLVGRVKESSVHTQTRTGYDDSVVTHTYDNQVRVVPAIDTKLGVDYTVSFKNQADSSMTVEAGYQVTQYVGVFSAEGVGSRDSESSVGFNGPYLSLNFKM